MSSKKIRIVIADDHKVVREGTRELLQKESDLEVVGEAGDGEEAVELVKDLKPDVVIMDVAMPRLNGIDATKQIKLIEPSTAPPRHPPPGNTARSHPNNASGNS